MDGKMFDALAMALSRQRLSRRTATGFIGAALTTMAAAFPGADALAGKRRRAKVYRCKADSCDGTGGKECGRNGCYCYRHRRGYACVKGQVSSNNKRCRKDRNCPGEQVCVKSGPACGGGRGFCKRLCPRR
jgi:hypothetical protein